MTKQNTPFFDTSILEDEIKTHKRGKKDSPYFIENRYTRAHSVILVFIENDKLLPDKDLEVMRRYIKCFGKFGHLTMSEDAKKAIGIINLRQQQIKERAKRRPRYLLDKRKKTKNKKLYDYKDAKTLKQEAKRQVKARKNKRPSFFASLKTTFSPHIQKLSDGIKKAWQKLSKSRKYAIYPLIGLISLTGGIFGAQKLSSSKAPKDKVENVQKPTGSQTFDVQEIAALTPQQVENKTFQTKTDSLTTDIEQARKNYYDTALEIHLGTPQKRDELYASVERQIANGNFKPEQGMTIEKIAHSLTMYQLLAPNSQANHFLQQMLRADKTNPSEQNKMNHLFAQTSKLKGSIQNSNFDKQKPELQKRHIANIQKLRQLSR